MLSVLKFKNNTNIFFTSDAHLGQSCSSWSEETKLWRTRGYSSPEDHIEGWIKRFNSVCDNESTVIHIGDLIFECNTGAKFLSIIPRLNFKTLILGLGNHNASQKQIYKSELKRLYPDLPDDVEVYPLRSNLIGREIIFMPVYFEIQVDKDFICCSHYPLLSHHNMRRGSFLATAHSHGNLKITSLEGSGKRLDCGFDVHSKPISIQEMRKIMATREIDSLDHH